MLWGCTVWDCVVHMRNLGDDLPLTMDYLEAVRQEVRQSGDLRKRALLSEIRRLQRMILRTARYTRTVTTLGGSVHINQSLLEDLHRQCMAEPIVFKDAARKCTLLAPGREKRAATPDILSVGRDNEKGCNGLPSNPI